MECRVEEVWIILCIFSCSFFFLCASIIPFPMYMDMRIFFPWVFKHVVLQVYVTTGVQCMVSVVETSSYRWLRRIVCAASHRIARRPSPRSVTLPLCARALQRRSNAARRSRECGVEGTKAQQRRAAIHQQDHPCRSLHVTTAHAPASTEKRSAGAKSRYVCSCMYLPTRRRDGGRGRGRCVCYEPNQGIKRGGGYLFF